MIGIIDADLIGRKKHRFPNLACMKISSYYKQQGKDVQLLLNYNNLDQYEKVYVSKVFTDTPVPELTGDNIVCDGTGFYYDQAAPLPYEIEHVMPDYHLYDEWLQSSTFKHTEIKYYTEYSIGFLTRGCFRHCDFCVNKNIMLLFHIARLQNFMIRHAKKYVCSMIIFWHVKIGVRY